MLEKEDKFLIEFFDSIFFHRMCAEQVELFELKMFVVRKQLEKISDIITKKIDEINKKKNASSYNITIEDRAELLCELTRLETIISIIQNCDKNNLDSRIGVIDTCNITLNGEENCDIIIGKATEDELQIYVYELMKQFEKNKSKQKIK